MKLALAEPEELDFVVGLYFQADGIEIREPRARGIAFPVLRVAAEQDELDAFVFTDEKRPQHDEAVVTAAGGFDRQLVEQKFESGYRFGKRDRYRIRTRRGCVDLATRRSERVRDTGMDVRTGNA